MIRRPRLRLMIAACVCGAAVFPTQSRAQELGLTAQAKAARAEFLVSATPSGPTAEVCLVDTGVTPTPETSAVWGRFSIAADSADTSSSLHGTRMAMFMAAPANGYGMIGIWPAARIVSVAANRGGEEPLLVGLVRGLQQCELLPPPHEIKVAVITSTRNYLVTREAQEALEEEVAIARFRGYSIVMAAPSNGGLPLTSPAGIPGILAVGASTAGGTGLCALTATGARLLAPGCGLDGSDPITAQAISPVDEPGAAAAIAAVTLAALRTWRPDLTAAEAERVLVENARATPAGPALDATAAFAAAGLGSLIPPGPSSTRMPAPLSLPAATSPPEPRTRLPRPRLTFRLRGHGKNRTLSVTARNRPRGARLAVRVYARTRDRGLKLVSVKTRQTSAIRFRLPDWARVRARFTDPSGQRETSPTAIVNHRR
jgi:hypothetical protein